MQIYKVDEPKHQCIEEIKHDFWGNFVIMRDVTFHPKGGTVIYYCKRRTDEFLDLLMRLDENPELNGYPDFMYIGPVRNFIGRLS